ncbi:antitoxin of toxin-antitoxin stability system [Lactobacillus sp. CC-MHH1034]|uniref:antitoxin of toxin-antitoxin stability system n=1 Tax=Agrilactobacillus fermenti TaxID=2586909 RepID=UPI001E290B14|nr:antitoxin of toxin-antitoxin stability system [Agrilactobacillus fermenti]MCD2256361.1 antitoxin of toxin-antitoxin stability system [Agrilactobacillus fermenti]
MTVKIQNLNNTTFLPVPDYIKPIAAEYNVHQNSDGTIIYTPIHKNPFHDERFINAHDLTQKEAFTSKLTGKELLE